MKKQLVVKKKVDDLPIDIKEVCLLIKRLNKNSFFPTQSRIIFNPVNIYGDRSFFTASIEANSYNISIRKEEWKIPQYATEIVDKIHQVVKQNTPNISIKSDDSFVTYMIPMQRIVGDSQFYYRMHFNMIRKQTKEKIISSRFIQQNGREIKPIFKKSGNISYISTSSILQASIHFDKHLNKGSLVIFKYQIDTKTGNITKAVWKACAPLQEPLELSSIQQKLIAKRQMYVESIIRD